MGFWSRLFGRKKVQEPEEQDWEGLVYEWDNVDFTDDEQRAQYVAVCLEQMADVSREMSLLNGEYSRVTAYLTDIEEIEALPDEERDAVNGIAKRMLTFTQERRRYQDKQDRMSDSDYYRMKRQEAEVQEGIDKLKECEDYGALVRQDMKRLDRERSAYAYRKAELDSMLRDLRGITVIFTTALAVCVVMLLVLQLGFGMNTMIGYAIAVITTGIALTVLMVKYTDADKEKRRVERAVNKLILLQNKVKIRYVNNSNLKEYLCIKYGTESASALEDVWTRYQQEKEERKQYAEAEAKLDYYQKQLLSRLSRYNITDPDRWTDRPEALLDKREMVEMRHELILRRQALRKQMDYNSGVAETIRNDIMSVAKRYPDYAAEILAMADRYEDA